ncbi:hypothetical protein L6164_003517 [Bauhinia variegata]|uniref:Uncharacterized protein n=1 Tax=Bauhinia variegata TaxID=167791 RepID=A0ACB9Q126_BAUVA|nr:hypothetical protein L6164_003517 [Bauhinia variegata]
MKSSISLAFFFFLLFAFSAANDVVYDIDGQPLTFGDRYQIIPALRGKGGGLELGKTGNDSCPISVVQARSEVNSGLQVDFLIGLPVINITEGTPLIIRFPDERPSCVRNPTAWDVVEEFPQGWSVKLEYFEIRFGPFRIKKVGQYDYKIIYCRSSDNVCADLGIKNRRLIVRDGNPFLVRFKKAIGSSAE